MNNVVLVGFMGSGKSTVGPQLAQRMDRPFVDLDDVIEADAGRSVAEGRGTGAIPWLSHSARKRP